jgi:hypothetical protein
MTLKERLDDLFKRWGGLSNGQREDLRTFVDEMYAAGSNGTTLLPLDAGQITALPNNTLYMDSSNVLTWKNNAGASKVVTIAV